MFLKYLKRKRTNVINCTFSNHMLRNWESQNRLENVCDGQHFKKHNVWNKVRIWYLIIACIFCPKTVCKQNTYIRINITKSWSKLNMGDHFNKQAEGQNLNIQREISYGWTRDTSTQYNLNKLCSEHFLQCLLSGSTSAHTFTHSHSRDTFNLHTICFPTLLVLDCEATLFMCLCLCMDADAHCTATTITIKHHAPKIQAGTGQAH